MRLGRLMDERSDDFRKKNVTGRVFRAEADRMGDLEGECKVFKKT